MEKTTIYELMGFVLAFLGIGVAYFAIYLGTRNERLKRELEQKERMKALEVGRSPARRPSLAFAPTRRLPHRHPGPDRGLRLRLPRKP